MRYFSTLFTKIILFFLITDTYVYSQSNVEKYIYKEGFEKNNPIKYWISTKNLPKPIIKYALDNNTSTKGEKSLLIDANIKGFKNNKNWFYYLRIPLNQKANLDKNLSFSMDIKIDKFSSKYVTVGLNLEYLPASSGIYSFNKISIFNKWTTIKADNLKIKTSNINKNWIKNNIYNATQKDIGVAINYIGIFIKGQGDKHIKFNIDNIKLVGTQTKDKLFIKKYKKNWNKYILKTRKNINQIRKIIDKLSKKYPKQLKEIKSILHEIEDKNYKNQYFKPQLIEKLHAKIDSYKKENITIYKFPTMKDYRLNGKTKPKLEKAKSYQLRMTAGEYHSIGLLIKANNIFDNYYNIEVNGFNNIDFYIAKIWYQAGLKNTNKTGKFLTQELLLKDENLIKVDTKTKKNYLKVVDNNSNQEKYIDISTPNIKFPKTNSIRFNDAKKLQPFKLNKKYKLIWGIVHIPEKTTSGVYKANIQLKNSLNKILKNIPITIEVLPFKLDKSKLTYSLYYHGSFKKDAPTINAFYKNYKQLEIELQDMKNHGVLYPVSHDRSAEILDKALDIRDKIGFPKDKFYSLGIIVYQKNIDKKIQRFKQILLKHKYNIDNFYIYGQDEAKEEKLKKEIKQINMAHKYGVKVFVAGNFYTYKHIGKVLDTFIYAGGALRKDKKEQVDNWHKSKHKIFAYASPQVGVENPEVYRRNFGCKLWKNNFDGAMNYAYQKQYGDFWNDFDSDPKAPSYREEAFTYPTTNGIIGTVEWEGYRQAITDVRYISTLENIRDKLKAEGKNSEKLDNWLNNIDCNSDLSILREEIINKILLYKK